MPTQRRLISARRFQATCVAARATRTSLRLPCWPPSACAGRRRLSVLGEPAPRSEDLRLLTGQGLFVDDVDLPGMLHCAFLRSPHAHAKVLRIDASAAARREGVVAVYTAADLGSYLQPAPLLVHPPPIEGSVFHTRTHLPLA